MTLLIPLLLRLTSLFERSAAAEEETADMPERVDDVPVRTLKKE